MSKRIGNTVIIEQTKPDICNYCGEVSETRPYGINGAQICYNCAYKPENSEHTEHKLLEFLTGKDK